MTGLLLRTVSAMGLTLATTLFVPYGLNSVVANNNICWVVVHSSTLPIGLLPTTQYMTDFCSGQWQFGQMRSNIYNRYIPMFETLCSFTDNSASLCLKYKTPSINSLFVFKDYKFLKKRTVGSRNHFFFFLVILQYYLNQK
jgi:hypothetical protein